MLDFITRFFRREEASGSQAKERLRLVLMSDRVSLAPEIFDAMKGEMISVVRRYLDIDEGGLDVHFESAERRFMLLANIPVLSIRPKPNGDGHAALVSEKMPRRRRRRRKPQVAPDAETPSVEPDAPVEPDTSL
ncbi:MAG TPA: cell division topological specificity factor MinE [Candidatus Tumulicola sp.]|nr:cell division topological specificity factor MinE [Candidatus Tumulicola sp.]